MGGGPLPCGRLESVRVCGRIVFLVTRSDTGRVQDGGLGLLGARAVCRALAPGPIVPHEGHALPASGSGVCWPRPWALRANLSPDLAGLQALFLVVARRVSVSAQQVHLW